jgi:hypothetical protein
MALHLGNSRDYYGFNPLNIMGCEAWFDGKDSSSVTLTGGAVSQWNDKSGNNYHVLEANAANRPTYNSNTGAIVFSDSVTTQSLRNTSPPYLSTYSIYAVYRPNTGSTGIVLDHRYTIGAIATAGFYTLTGSGLTAGYGNVLSRRTQSWTLSSTVTVLGFFSSVGSGTFSYNGAGAAATSTTTNITNSTNIFTVGNSSQSNASTFNGDIYEIIFYNRILTSNENQVVTGYLGWKWGNPSTYSPAYPITNRYYYTPPLSRALTPIDIFNNNVVLWLDGADDSTMQFSSGTTVAQWVDKASNIAARVYTEPTGSVAYTGPTYTASIPPQNITSTSDAGSLFFNNGNTNVKSAGQNGLRLMRSGEAANSFTPLSMTSLNYAVYIVYKSTRATNTTLNDIIQIRPLGSSANYGYSEYHIEIGQGGGPTFTGPFIANGSSVQFSTSTSWSTANQYNILGVFYTGTNGSATASVNIRMNGTQFTAISGSVGTAIASQVDFTLFTIGAHVDNRQFSGYIKEIIVVDGITISDRDVRILEGYLAWKWRLEENLPTTHDFKTHIPSTVTPFQNLSASIGNACILYNTNGDPLYRFKCEAGTTAAVVNDCTIDVNNNIITCGDYEDVALTLFDKDDNAFPTTLPFNGTAICGYLVKYGPQGRVKWARHALCTTDTTNGYEFTNVATDSSLGVYAGGCSITTGSTSINKIIAIRNGATNLTTFTTGTGYDNICCVTRFNADGTFAWNSRMSGNTTSGSGERQFVQCMDGFGSSCAVGGNFESQNFTISPGATLTRDGTKSTAGFFVIYGSASSSPSAITRIGGGFPICVSYGGLVVYGCYFNDATLEIFSGTGTTAVRSIPRIGTNRTGVVIQYNTSLTHQRSMQIGSTTGEVTIYGVAMLSNVGSGISMACGGTSGTSNFYNASSAIVLTLTKGSETRIPFLVSYSATGVPQWVLSTSGNASTVCDFLGMTRGRLNQGVYVFGRTNSSVLTFSSISSSGITFQFENRGFTSTNFSYFVAYYSISGIIKWVRQIVNTVTTQIGFSGNNGFYSRNNLLICKITGSANTFSVTALS